MTTFTLVEPAPTPRDILPPQDLSVSGCFRLAARRLGIAYDTLRKKIYQHELTLPVEVLAQELVKGGHLDKAVALTAGITQPLNDAKLPATLDEAVRNQQRDDISEESVEETFRWALQNYRENGGAYPAYRKELINAIKQFRQATDVEIASKLELRGCLVRELEELQENDRGNR